MWVQVRVGEDAALGHHHPLGRHAWREPLRRGERGIERLEVAVVDADQLGTEAKRPLELSLVMHFSQQVHSERPRRKFQVARECVIHGGHDDEDAVGTESARLKHLIWVDHEILAQARQAARGTSEGEVFWASLERWRVG
jgi:hypothetical protein